MFDLIKATRAFIKIRKPVRRNCPGMWETEYAVLVNRTLLIACHESHTKCGVHVKILLNAPVLIREMRRAQKKHCHKRPK